MSEEQVPTLIDLDDANLILENPDDDIRGRKVIDRNEQEFGEVDGLLVDERDEKVRFLRIASGGFLGLGKTKRLVPIDAITRVGDDAVHIDRTKEHVAGTSPYDPQVVSPTYYETVYGEYGFPPFWAPGYLYPLYR